MAFDVSDATYQDLLARVLQSETQVVPFVGAGLGLYGADDERLPLWRELLDRLIAEGKHLGLVSEQGDERIEKALKARRYIQATDLILDAIGEPTFRRVVERELDESGKPVPPAITEMVSVGWSLIVTTNLDRMIARAYLERYGRPMSQVTSQDTRQLAAALAGSLVSTEAVLAQIHGDIGSYESWRLTQSHYDQLLTDPGYVEALKHLFLRNVFFVGFGLQDDDFEFLFRTIANIYPAGVGEFYALIDRRRKDDPVVTRLIRQNGLRPIFYDVDPAEDPSGPFGGHRAVYECLGHLASTWAAARTGLNLNLKYFPELDQDVVGREREMARLRTLAEDGGVAQIVGLGGVGKTSLVQQFLMEERPTLAAAGYRQVFGSSFYRADVGQFIQDMALTVSDHRAAPLNERVQVICEQVRRHRTALVLDGLEAIIDDDHRLGGPYVSEIAESVLRGGGIVVVTSRVPVRGGLFESALVIDVEPLSAEEILVFLRRWGLDRLGDAASRRLIEITGGHPLALRILAGVLQGVPASDAIATVERSAVIDTPDELDPLRENRLARIFGSYFDHLNEAAVSFMECLTAFAGPAPYALIQAAFTRAYPDTTVNRPLVGQDLRQLVGELIERRLLIISTNGDLSSHPTVREYFARRLSTDQSPLVPIHRFLVAASLEGAPARPETFEEALPLIAACRHAASCRDWSLFQDLFRRRLMRDFREYLCENLGAWEEALSLARLAEDPSFPTDQTPQSGYYAITVARCLKHLGRSSESRGKYLEALQELADGRDPDTAIYVNNFLTLLVWRGELGAAEWLAELNVRSLSWIGEPWRHRWQVEHGFSSIGYLRLLQGQLDDAASLFAYSERAWDGHPEDRPWFYDYYPYYRSELLLLADPSAHDDALASIETLLAVAESLGWPESICRGHLQAASIHLDRALMNGDRKEFVQASQRIERAGSVAAGLHVADATIAYNLMRVKEQLFQREIYAGAQLDTQGTHRLIERLEILVETSGLALARPEVLAARGLLALLDGRSESARETLTEAIWECQRQGNMLFPRSPRSLVNLLGRRLGIEVDQEVSGFRSDLIGLVGSDMTVEWMVDRLSGLDAAGHLGAPRP